MKPAARVSAMVVHEAWYKSLGTDQREEEHTAKQMEAGHSEGKGRIPVLFEKVDGVWLSMQESVHKKMKKQEVKVFTMYEGWDAESKGRSLPA